MNKAALFLLILLGVGTFLWLQRDRILPPDSGSIFDQRTSRVLPQKHERFVIREKVTPGSYLGWRATEKTAMTESARQTRRASRYYFVCTEMGSGTKRIFKVSARAFHFGQVGNVLTSQQVNEFQEVSEIREPDFPSNFDFRRREPSP